MKKCAKCAAEKPSHDFYASGRSGGLSARCKECHGLADRNCVVCGVTFLGRFNARCCSAACRGALRPKMTKTCGHCKRVFSADRGDRQFCCNECKVAAQSTGRRKRFVRCKVAARAQRAVAYAIETGRLIRPAVCECCGSVTPVEAAHEDYDEPLSIRWLCIPCHRRWDHAQPKGGGFSVEIA